MAIFTFNGGNVTPIQIDPKYNSTKIFVSGSISLTSKATPLISIAGHSVLDLNSDFSIEDVQFDDHLLDYAFNLTGKTLQIAVNVGKVQTSGAVLSGADLVATCSLTFDAGNNLINSYTLDDSSDPELSSTFKFSFSF